MAVAVLLVWRAVGGERQSREVIVTRSRRLTAPCSAVKVAAGRHEGHHRHRWSRYRGKRLGVAHDPP